MLRAAAQLGAVRAGGTVVYAAAAGYIDVDVENTLANNDVQKEKKIKKTPRGEGKKGFFGFCWGTEFYRGSKSMIMIVIMYVPERTRHTHITCQTFQDISVQAYK